MNNFVDNEFNNYNETSSYCENRDLGSFVNRAENQPLTSEISTGTHQSKPTDDDKAKKNKSNSNKIVTIAMQASGAVCTAAVVVAMVVAMPFSVTVDVRDITAASAIVEIDTELISEQGDFTAPIYEVNEIESSDVVATGDAPIGKTVFPIGGLKSDTQYRVAVKQGEDILKEYVFRTLITEKLGRDKPINEPQVAHLYDETSGQLDMSLSWQPTETDAGKVVTIFTVSSGTDYSNNVFTATAEDGNDRFSTTLPIGEFRLHIETRYVLAKGGYSVLAEEVKALTHLPAEDNYYCEVFTDNFGDGFGIGASYSIFGLTENAKGKFLIRGTVAQNGEVLETKQQELLSDPEATSFVIFDSIVFGQVYDFDVQMLFVADTGTEFSLMTQDFANTQAYGNMGLEGLVVTPVYRVTEFEGENLVALALNLDWSNVRAEVRDFYLIEDNGYQFIARITDAVTDTSDGIIDRSGGGAELNDGTIYLHYYPGFVPTVQGDIIIKGALMSAKRYFSYSIGFALPDGMWDNGTIVLVEPTDVAGFGAGDARVAGQNSIGGCLPDYFENAANGLDIVESEYVIIESDTATEVETFATADEALAFQPPTGTYEMRITKTYHDSQTGLDAVASYTIVNITIVS